MSIHDEGTNKPMLSATFEEVARKWVIELENHEAKAIGSPLPIARPALARKIGVAPGTLENIRRGRLKDIRRRVADRLQAYMIRHLQLEIQKHTHELGLVLASRKDARDTEIVAAQTILAKARSLLDEVAK